MKNVLRQNRASVAPIGSIRMPSQRRMVASGSVGRANPAAVLTVGPETTRIAPISDTPHRLVERGGRQGRPATR